MCASHVLPEFIFVPPPTNSVLNFEFDAHTFFSIGLTLLLSHEFVILLRADVSVWMEWFCIQFDKVWQTKDPMLRISMMRIKLVRCKVFAYG